jgi:hypothetical protein
MSDPGTYATDLLRRYAESEADRAVIETALATRAEAVAGRIAAANRPDVAEEERFRTTIELIEVMLGRRAVQAALDDDEEELERHEAVLTAAGAWTQAAIDLRDAGESETSRRALRRAVSFAIDAD